MKWSNEHVEVNWSEWPERHCQHFLSVYFYMSLYPYVRPRPHHLIRHGFQFCAQEGGGIKLKGRG